MDDANAQGLAEAAYGGGRLATLISAVAFLFSGYSLYESALKSAELEVFVPPVIQYARDSGGDVELFAIPITIANGGANTGTVLAMELTVANSRAEGDLPKQKTYYSAFIGEHARSPDAPRKAFAPISITGRGTYSETVRFYPQGSPLPRLVTDAGEYEFRLRLIVARPPSPGLLDRLLAPDVPAPLAFTMRLPWISDQQLGFRRATIDMHTKDYKPTVAAQK
jgi:hypothetical protein